MYVIVGDSWGLGEWEHRSIKHDGLCQYLRDAGHSVINISVAGSSNWGSFRRLKLIFDSHINQNLNTPLSHRDKILFFQTEWHRDFSFDTSDTVAGLDLPKNLHDIHTWTICNTYYRLSELAQTHNVPIYLIGGRCDTLWLDQFQKEYPGLYIACQSMTNLCINDNHRIDAPVLGGVSHELAKIMRSRYDDTKITEIILDLIQQMEVRSNLWHQHKTWFYPDGIHANRLAHKKLFNWLVQSQLV